MVDSVVNKLWGSSQFFQRNIPFCSIWDQRYCVQATFVLHIYCMATKVPLLRIPRILQRDDDFRVPQNIDVFMSDDDDMRIENVEKSILASALR